MTRIVPVTVRVWRRIEVAGPDECWLWRGATKPGGYGSIGTGTEATGRSSTQAHRAAYESAYGPIPEGLVIDHLCGVRACCNPAHLEAVTQAENMARSATSLPTRNAAKTHCPRNHEYSEANTYIGKKNTRFCRTCDRENQRRIRDAKRVRKSAA